MKDFSNLLLLVISIILISSEKTIQQSKCWLAWQPWSSECERHCSQPIGEQFRSRKCFEPISHTIESSDEFVCNGVDIERRFCYIGNECMGDGQFTGVYSTWTRVNSTRPELNNIESIFQRTCLPSNKTYKEKRFFCYDLLGPGEIKLEKSKANNLLNKSKIKFQVNEWKNSSK